MARKSKNEAVIEDAAPVAVVDEIEPAPAELPAEDSEVQSAQKRLIMSDGDAKMKLVRMKLDELPTNGTLVSPPPTQNMLDSVQMHGILTPVVIVRELGTGKIAVVQGRRRIKSARLCELKDIPVLVREVAKITPKVIAITNAMLDNLSEENPLTDWEAVKALMDDIGNKANSETDAFKKVGEILRMSPSKVERIWTIGQLPAPIVKAVQKGKVTMRTAERLSKEGPAIIAKAVDHLAETDRLSDADVSRLRQVSREQVAFDFNFPTTPAADGVAEAATEGETDEATKVAEWDEAAAYLDSKGVEREMPKGKPLSLKDRMKLWVDRACA